MEQLQLLMVKQTPEHLAKRVASRKLNNPNWWKNKEQVVQKNADKQRQYWANGKYSLDKQGVRGRELFKKNNPMRNPQIASKTIFNRYKGEPSKYEKILIEMINRYNLPYVYVGNGKLIIMGKCPDFKHKTENKLIELHINNKGKEIKQEIYRENGYECLWIKNSELAKEVEVVRKIAQPWASNCV